MPRAFPVSVAGQCLRPDCPVGPPDPAVVETSSTSAMTDQPFAELAMGDSMDTDLLPEMSGETLVATVHLNEVTGDLTPTDSDPDMIASSLADKTLTVVRDWLRASTPPTWSECAGLSPLRSWRIQFGNLSLDSGAVCSSNVTMILYLRVTWVYLRLFAICWIMFIGQDCVKISDPIWLVVLSA